MVLMQASVEGNPCWRGHWWQSKHRNRSHKSVPSSDSTKTWV